MTITRFLVLAAFCGASSAQPLTYTLLPSSGTAPSGRVDGTIAYDPVGQQVFLFGGQDNEVRNDLWAYSLERRQWSEVSVTGDRPAPRLGHTLLFDPVRRRLILFGGQARGFFSDVWAFDIAQGSWRLLAPDDRGPSRRYGHSAVYDPRADRIVISHGFTNSGRFDDTWAFDLETNTWRNISPASPRPVRRCLHHAVLDTERSIMYLYGGCASPFGPCPLGDLRAFDLATNQWSERTGGTLPPAREHYGRAFDPVRRRVVIFGGSAGSLLNDTWEYDVAGNRWSAATLMGMPPSARSRHESAYAADRGLAIFLGGRDLLGRLTNELWTLGPAVETRTPMVTRDGVRNAFSGEAGSVAPGQLVSLFGAGLGPETGIALGFDAGGRLPVSTAGVSVRWNGIASPIYFVRADQINVQVPYELTGLRSAFLVVTANGTTSAPVEVTITPAQPGLAPVVLNPDGSLNSAAAPANPGDIIVFYGTGQGPTVPASVTGMVARDPFPEPLAPLSVTIGGIPAEVLFRGQAPGTAGVTQINARIPVSVPPGPASIAVGIGSVMSPPGPVVFLRRS